MSARVRRALSALRDILRGMLGPLPSERESAAVRAGLRTAAERRPRCC
jgi:hypothetical protein